MAAAASKTEKAILPDGLAQQAKLIGGFIVPPQMNKWKKLRRYNLDPSILNSLEVR